MGVGVRCATCSCSLLLSKVRLVVHQGINSLDKVFIALWDLFNRASTIVLWYSFDIQNLQEFEFYEVVVRELVLLCDSISDQVFDVTSCLFVYRL